MRLILASKSPRRKKLLESLGLEFDVVVSNADEESVNEEGMAEHVQKIAELKVNAVAKENPDAIIIGADSMVVFEGKRIGKPKDEEDAVRILKMLSGNTHEVYTGIIVKNIKTGKVLRNYDVTKVTFRDLTDREIKEWVKNPECLGGAGAYTDKIHHVFFDRISGSHTNVFGLPIRTIIPMLREIGVDV